MTIGSLCRNILCRGSYELNCASSNLKPPAIAIGEIDMMHHYLG